MRYVFIVNPAAGKKDPYQSVFPLIQDYFHQKGIEFTCHITSQPRQATELARQQGEKGDEVRLYAVGGDGTLSEVAAGVIGMENVEVGVIPCGTGNDYVKTFGNPEDFLSFAKQLKAPSNWVDMIESEGHISMNLCSIGMDAKVAYEMVKFKRIPLLSGPGAYEIALVKTLLGRIGEHLKVTIDGTNTYEGTYLFALAGNGKYYGGGYCGAPRAMPDDGLLDFILIKKPRLSQIPALVKEYKAGRHLESPLFGDLVTYRRGLEMKVEADRPVIANFDGECHAIDHVFFKVIPHAVRFIVPN
ncbi:MAG TPA: YegS/Rv2252/BmrU family lipid kinase [Caproiciproducens sp.]|nr:YegS/Rv2252/BmrU family lipid kinase [Caproiciproducens sp.]